MLIVLAFPLAVSAILAFLGYRRLALAALVLACVAFAFLGYGAWACHTDRALIAAGGCW